MSIFLIIKKKQKTLDKIFANKFFYAFAKFPFFFTWFCLEFFLNKCVFCFIFLKGFEKESWKPQKNGCATSEDMLWKLGALQMFIKDLHWPEEVFAEHLDHRLKLMAADMIEAAATRTRSSFEATMKRGSKGTDFIVPTEVCVMMNSITDFKNCALKLCALESGVDMVRRDAFLFQFSVFFYTN